MKLLKECDIKNSGGRGVPISENSRKFLHIGDMIYIQFYLPFKIKLLRKITYYKLHNMRESMFVPDS